MLQDQCLTWLLVLLLYHYQVLSYSMIMKRKQHVADSTVGANSIYNCEVLPLTHSLNMTSQLYAQAHHSLTVPDIPITACEAIQQVQA